MYKNPIRDNNKLEFEREEREKLIRERKANRGKHRNEFYSIQRMNRKDAAASRQT